MTKPSPSIFDDLHTIGENLCILREDRLALRHPGEHRDNYGCGVLAAPSSTGEAAAIVRWCMAKGIAIVPQGGRTGLAGGAVSGPGDLILSSERLNAIEGIDAQSQTAVVGGGVTLEALQAAAREVGLTPGIDLASRGSATIGGMVSTNAGGILAFRNGVMRHQVLGIEAVLPDGSVFSDLTEVVKTSAGPDMKHLLVGAEGAFGFITRVALRLEAIRPHRATALIGLASARGALDVVGRLQTRAAIRLEGAELMWRRFFTDSAATHGFDTGWSGDAEAVLLVEVSAASAETAEAELGAVLEEAWEPAAIAGGILARSLSEARRFWDLREASDFIYRLHPETPSFDVSLPPRALDTYVAAMRRRLAALGLEAYVYGHIADGNLHLSVIGDGATRAAMRLPIENAVYSGIADLAGSFSAEHGVGREKQDAYLSFGNAGRRQLALTVKRALDPKGLFNPGKVPF